MKEVASKNVNSWRSRCLSSIMLMLRTYQNIMRIKLLPLNWNLIPSGSPIRMIGRRFMGCWVRMMNSGRISRFRLANRKLRFRTWRSGLLLPDWSSRNRLLAWAPRWSWLLRLWSDRLIRNREELSFSKLRRESSTRLLRIKTEKSRPFMRPWSISRRSRKRKLLNKNHRSTCWETHWLLRIKNLRISRLISNNNSRERVWSWLKKIRIKILTKILRKNFMT